MVAKVTQVVQKFDIDDIVKSVVELICMRGLQMQKLRPKKGEGLY